jgi:hypothetical protein
VTEGRVAPPEGLAVLRDRGLHEWLAVLTTTSPPWPRAPASAAPRCLPTGTRGRRSPLLDLCTDLLIATLIPKENRSS